MYGLYDRLEVWGPIGPWLQCPAWLWQNGCQLEVEAWRAPKLLETDIFFQQARFFVISIRLFTLWKVGEKNNGEEEEQHGHVDGVRKRASPNYDDPLKRNDGNTTITTGFYFSISLQIKSDFLRDTKIPVHSFLPVHSLFLPVHSFRCDSIS